jgi:four helix bundle protein
MNAQALALQARTRAFAKAVIKLCEELPTGPAADSIREQLLDSSGSTDSNYRAACCATDSAKALAHEADELVAIFVQSEKTAKRNYEAEQARRRATVKRKSRSRS